MATAYDNGPLGDRPLDSKPVSELISDALQQLSRLVRSEVALARAEVTGKAKQVARGGAMLAAAAAILLISDPLKGLIYSQMLLSIQLPITIFTQIYLTSSRRIMGKHANSGIEKVLLWAAGLVVAGLNIALLVSFL